jgi:hypothetical protein
MRTLDRTTVNLMILALAIFMVMLLLAISVAWPFALVGFISYCALGYYDCFVR